MEFGCVSCFAADTLNKSSAECFAKGDLSWGWGGMKMWKAKVPAPGSRAGQGHSAHRAGHSPKAGGSCCHIAYISDAAEDF